MEAVVLFGQGSVLAFILSRTDQVRALSQGFMLFLLLFLLFFHAGFVLRGLLEYVHCLGGRSAEERGW